MKLAEFALERFFAKHEFQVKHLLCASDCEPLSTRELLELEPGSTERLLDQRLGYTRDTGHPELRAAIAALYTATGAEQVLVFSGAEEPIFAFMNVVLEPGDAVIVHAPCYQSLHEVARAAGAQVTRFEAREAQLWQLDPDELPKLVTPRTRALVINSPHNPTGALLSRERFEAIVAFARHRGLWLFSDEAYRELEHDPAAKNPAACDAYERAVSLGTTAKAYGLAGLRIGWLSSREPALLDRLAAFKDYTTICASAPSEFLATIALRHHQALAQRSRAQVLANLKVFQAFAASEGLGFVRPQAGSTLFAARDDGERWCAQVLASRGVAFAPGRLFQADPDHFRVGLGRRGFAAGLEALAQPHSSS